MQPELTCSVTEIPFLGLGLSASPQQAVDICEARVKDIQEYRSLNFLNIGITSDIEVPGELPTHLAKAGLRSVIHLEEFNLVTDVDRERLESVLQRVRLLNSPWLEQDLGFWIWGQLKLQGHMLNPILDKETLEATVSNIKWIMERSQMLFLAENPPIAFSVEEMDLLTFMEQLASETRCGLVLDIGHLVGYCLVTERSPFDYIANHCSVLDHVVELHIAGYDFYNSASHQVWVDDHSIPIRSEALDLLAYVLQLAKNVKAIALEQEGAPPDVVRTNLAAVTELVQIQA